MDVEANINLIWWITAVELPVLAALFFMVWSSRKQSEETAQSIRENCELQVTHICENLTAYKLEVAKSYASIAYMKDVERRLTGHLVRIENRLDAMTAPNPKRLDRK